MCLLFKKSFSLRGYTLLNFLQTPHHFYLFIQKMRNHKSVAIASFRSFIPLDEHLQFREKLRLKNRTAYWLVKKDKTILGVISLTVTGIKAKIGLYKNPFLPQRGIGKELLTIIEEVAKRCKLEVLELEVKRDNKRALRLYFKKGFKVKANLSKILKLSKKVGE